MRKSRKAEVAMNIPGTFTSSKKNGATMLEPTIFIAANNQRRRTRMARALAEKGCPVKTTGSAASLMESLLHGGLSVVVLGDGLEEGLSVTALIPLLKICSPHSTIILATDDVSPTEERTVRQQGIFYRINRPVCSTGWDELQLAVEYACNKVMLGSTPAYTHSNQSRV
jgi:DNA-binding NtrC family response regulator